MDLLPVGDPSLNEEVSWTPQSPLPEEPVQVCCVCVSTGGYSVNLFSWRVRELHVDASTIERLDTSGWWSSCSCVVRNSVANLCVLGPLRRKVTSSLTTYPTTSLLAQQAVDAPRRGVTLQESGGVTPLRQDSNANVQQNIAMFSSNATSGSQGNGVSNVSVPGDTVR